MSHLYLFIQPSHGDVIVLALMLFGGQVDGDNSSINNDDNEKRSDCDKKIKQSGSPMSSKGRKSLVLPWAGQMQLQINYTWYTEVAEHAIPLHQI